MGNKDQKNVYKMQTRGVKIAKKTVWHISYDSNLKLESLLDSNPGLSLGFVVSNVIEQWLKKPALVIPGTSTIEQEEERKAVFDEDVI